MEAACFDAGFAALENLPQFDDMDTAPREWRAKVVAEAQQRGFPFTHGVAAKLINVYLKVRLDGD